MDAPGTSRFRLALYDMVAIPFHTHMLLTKRVFHPCPSHCFHLSSYGVLIVEFTML
jgi:hypothetical protein